MGGRDKPEIALYGLTSAQAGEGFLLQDPKQIHLHLGADGTHLVEITERVEPRLPEFDQVRDRVSTDYARVRRERANQLLLEGLSAEYEISIDSAAIRGRSLEGLKEAVE